MAEVKPAGPDPMMMTFSIIGADYLGRSRLASNSLTPCDVVDWKLRMSISNSERRIQKRAQVEIEIDLGTYEKYFLTKLENVSIGGAFIRTRTMYPVGTEMDLKFKLPDDHEAIDVKGEVVWTYDQPGNREPNSSGVGVKFKNIQESDRQKIALFIARQTQS